MRNWQTTLQGWLAGAGWLLAVHAFAFAPTARAHGEHLLEFLAWGATAIVFAILLIVLLLVRGQPKDKLVCFCSLAALELAAAGLVAVSPEGIIGELGVWIFVAGLLAGPFVGLSWVFARHDNALRSGTKSD